MRALRALVLAVLGVVWLALVVYVVAMTVNVATAKDGGEILLLAPPVHVVLAAIGTGLALGIRGQVVGAGPPDARLAVSVIGGALAALALGTALFFVFAGFFDAILGSDTDDPGWWFATTFLIWVLPIALGVGCVVLLLNRLNRIDY